MKILVAPCAYKGTIAASALANAIESGILCADGDGRHEIRLAPVADGGDDTLACLQLSTGGELVYHKVTGPVSQLVDAAYLSIGDTAVIELAQASGIAHLKPEQLAPLTAHTYGTGELIAHAIEAGARKIVVTLGGSASTDGGTGLLSALGAKFLDRNGDGTTCGGGSLSTIYRVDLSEMKEKTAGIKFLIATDVTNPLLGDNGAAAVFARQKGASSSQVLILEQGLADFADCLESSCQPNLTLRAVSGAGAAGGAGYGLATALGAQATFVSGFHWLAGQMHLSEKIEWCDLLVIAEGCLDSQSMSGKATGELLLLARHSGKAVIALPAICRLAPFEQGHFNAILATASQPYSSNDCATLASVSEAAKSFFSQELNSIQSTKS